MEYEELSLINFVAILLPSGMAYTCAGLSLLGIHLRLKDIVITGTLVALVTISTRILNIPTGLHTILISLSLVLFLVVLKRLSFRTAMLASLLSIAVVFIGNNLLMMPMLSILKISVEESFRIMGYHLIMAWTTEIIPVALIAILASRFDLVLLEAPEASQIAKNS